MRGRKEGRKIEEGTGEVRMPVRAWRLLAGFGWIVMAFLTWILLFDALVYFVFDYLQGQRQVQLPLITGIAFNVAGGAGTLIIPAVVAVLAMRSKLPGTGRQRAHGRGFPVETT